MNMGPGMNMGTTHGMQGMNMGTSGQGMNMNPGMLMSTTGQGMNMDHGMHMGSPGMAMGSSGLPMVMNSDGMNMPGMGGATTPDHMNMGGHMTSMNMPMYMYFHTGIMEYILFEDLMTSTDGQFIGACFAIFFLAFVYEVLKHWREFLARSRNHHVAKALLSGNSEDKLLFSGLKQMFSGYHFLQTFLHGIQIFISYCLMLIFMTYNVYLCLSVVLGATLGYFISRGVLLIYMEQEYFSTENTEHCH